jgi:resuscitation-promoting factor RpfB
MHVRSAINPSPARAEPHDPDAWLPLPVDVDGLPPLSALLEPDPDFQVSVILEAEAVVHSAYVAASSVVMPSPARAEPHDAATWLPLPDVHALPEVFPEPTPPPPLRHRVRHRLPAVRVFLIAVLASLFVVATAWVGHQLTAPAGSQVALSSNGHTFDGRTGAATVGELLAQHHVRLGPHDRVTPTVAASLHDGMRVTVERAFPVSIDFDGKVGAVLTTDRNATELASARGKLVAVRNLPGTLHAGSSVVLRTRHTGVLMLDGRSITYDSASLTVRELLATYSVTLVGDDRVEPSLDTALVNGMTPTVVRVGGELVQETESIPVPEQRQADPTLPIGQTRVIQDGTPGVMTVTYKVITENGAVTGRTLLSKVPTTDATPRIVGYGTQADWHWDKLAECESGGRWNTVDSGTPAYDGGLGILRSTWIAFGGLEYAPNAGLATREQQITIAQKIYNTYGGWSQSWGCARQMRWP